ncbi:MAG: ABC transporter ATP-binding protein [Kiritimatiellae bacterium]|nr:ABC transporter ATP-binding protein [Kiritimatiellia bacterium]
MDDFLVFKGVTKRFGAMTAVDDVTFNVKRGEFFSLLGPSGCGKTTLLRMLAGFERPDAGRIFLDGKDVTAMPPDKRRVNTVFQNYALFPHLTLWDNIAFGLRLQRRPKDEIEERVRRMLRLIQMEGQEWKKPTQISGGQKQRVAIARALVLEPQVLLLDEPLAALDLKLRQHMQIELDRIHDQVGITFLYVTHDQGEAMSLSDRIAVMNRGKVEQIDKPAALYEAPRSSFVAAFIGDTNFFEGTVTKLVDENYCRVSVEDFGEIVCFNDKHIKAGAKVYLSVRPEKMHLTHEKPADLHGGKVNVYECTVDQKIYQGAYTRFWVWRGASKDDCWELSVMQVHNRYLLDQQEIGWDEKVWLSWHADDGFMLESYAEQDEAMLPHPTEEASDAGAAPAPAPAPAGAADAEAAK